MTRREISINPDARLTDCEQKPSAVAWPLPVDRRLDELVERLHDLGERTTRKELAAAIVFGSEEDGERLSALLRRYRTASAKDALVEDAGTADVLQLPLHRPGPR